VSVGVDIGQKVDPSAIVVCEATERASGRMVPPSFFTNRTPRLVPHRETRYEARHMERLPLGTPYPAVAVRVAEVIESLRTRQAGDRDARDIALTVDATGVGQPVVDLLKSHVGRIRLRAATFTHGDRMEGDDEMRVGKAFLVSRLQTLLQTDCLGLPPGHPEAEAMSRELLDFEIRVDDDANDRYGAFKVGTHDDLVTALGLAVIEVADRRAWVAGDYGARYL